MMKYNLTKLFALALLLVALFITPINFAVAGTVKSDPAETAKQAAKEVVKDTGVLDQFGQSEKGKEFIEKAQEKASENLDKLAKKAESQPELPNSQELFLKNISDK